MTPARYDGVALDIRFYLTVLLCFIFLWVDEGVINEI